MPKSSGTAARIATSSEEAIARIDCQSGLTSGVPRSSEIYSVVSGKAVPAGERSEALPDMRVVEADRQPLGSGSASNLIGAVQCLLLYENGKGYLGFAKRAYTGDIPSLLRSIQITPTPAPSPKFCADILDAAPNLWLITRDFKAVPAKWVSDECGKHTVVVPETVLTDTDFSAIDPKAVTPLRTSEVP